jgi:hypothetical protein
MEPEKKKCIRFIRLPMNWSRIKSIILSPAEKLIVGYLNTRSTIKKVDGTAWTFSAADISYETGLSSTVAKKYIKVLENTDILKYFATIETKYNHGLRGYKIYHLSRENLLKYMKAMRQKNTERWHKAVALDDDTKDQ